MNKNGKGFNFGLAFDMRAPGFGASKNELYAAALDQCEWADNLGFDFCTFMEHHASSDGYLPSPIVMASAAAARTQHIEIRLSLLLLPLYCPIRVAEDLAVLDIISSGRLQIMVGAGYRPEEYEQFGLSIESRPSLMEESIKFLKDAWTGEPFEYCGRMLRILPTPVQEPRPAIVMGGSSRAAARRAARIADGFLPTDPALFEVYRAELESLGKEVPPPLPIMEHKPALFVHISEDPDQCWKAIRRHALHDASEYASWCGSLPHMPYHPVSTPEELRETGQYLVLTPEEAVTYARATGGITLKPLMGGLSPDIAWMSLKLFERDVMPELS